MRQSSYCEFKFILFPLRRHLGVQKFERCSSAARPRCSMSMDSVVAFSLYRSQIFAGAVSANVGFG